MNDIVSSLDPALYVRWIFWTGLLLSLLWLLCRTGRRFSSWLRRRIHDVVIVVLLVALMIAMLVDLRGCNGEGGWGDGRSGKTASDSGGATEGPSPSKGAVNTPLRVKVGRHGGKIEMCLTGVGGTRTATCASQDVATVLETLLEREQSPARELQDVSLVCDRNVPGLARMMIIDILRGRGASVKEEIPNG